MYLTHLYEHMICQDTYFNNELSHYFLELVIVICILSWEECSEFALLGFKLFENDHGYFLFLLLFVTLQAFVRGNRVAKVRFAENS